ncbi:MAG: phosphoribosylanthranilate isomerase [Xanthomonadales bacterium]|nr:phosphoribosylanthranilate isomerase [Gammaproteobacteria bacterium]NNE04802.1 phosphoribosylanthranilate isomerase [Xanthomonadales bacterium]NNL94474.1 phosphoribosylanthranilate isomerase [Xanthomonadales bacterium]
MERIKVKICGLTRQQDVIRAVSCGADFIGLVFANSPRQVDMEAAFFLLQDVPERVGKVALFMDQPAEFVRNVISLAPLDLLQFHGRESNDFCRQFDMPFTKAIPMAEPGESTRRFSDFPDASGLLLDSHGAGGAGGSGKVFDWSAVPRSSQKIWLAGGLDAKNVGQAIRQVRPWAVDVSSGVERRPGIKDHGLIESFINAAKAADTLHNQE